MGKFKITTATDPVVNTDTYYSEVLKELNPTYPAHYPPKPEVGMKVYVPTRLSISHGENDVVGGIAIISDITEYDDGGYNTIFVSFKDLPKALNWNWLMENQEEWARIYGNRLAYHDPDYQNPNELW